MTPLPASFSSSASQVAGRGAGLHVATVEERVHDDGHAALVRGVDEREELRDVAVHAAVGDETEEVQAAARGARLRP